MENIIKHLKENGFEIFDTYKDNSGNINHLYAKNDEVNIMILKREDGSYLVRNAILCFFDRWANSGVQHILKTENDVIKYFSYDDLITGEDFLTEALSEIVAAIIEDERVFKNKGNRVQRMVDFLNDLINEE